MPLLYFFLRFQISSQKIKSNILNHFSPTSQTKYTRIFVIQFFGGDIIKIIRENTYVSQQKR